VFTGIYQALVSKVNFHGYLISGFYPTCKRIFHARENNMVYSTVINIKLSINTVLLQHALNNYKHKSVNITRDNKMFDCLKC